MGLFGFSFGNGINQLVEEARTTEGAVILDVRTPEEFAGGHIEGAVNVPMNALNTVTSIAPSADTPLYTYCTMGPRAENAKNALLAAGYTHVVNMGGIMSYRGPKVK